MKYNTCIHGDFLNSILKALEIREYTDLINTTYLVAIMILLISTVHTLKLL